LNQNLWDSFGDNPLLDPNSSRRNKALLSAFGLSEGGGLGLDFIRRAMAAQVEPAADLMWQARLAAPWLAGAQRDAMIRATGAGRASAVESLRRSLGASAAAQSAALGRQLGRLGYGATASTASQLAAEQKLNDQSNALAAQDATPQGQAALARGLGDAVSSGLNNPYLAMMMQLTNAQARQPQPRKGGLSLGGLIGGLAGAVPFLGGSGLLGRIFGSGSPSSLPNDVLGGVLDGLGGAVGGGLSW
jgi:hypothetical protein